MRTPQPHAACSCFLPLLSVTSFALAARIPPQVSPIVEQVRAKGDDAVREFTAKFDRVTLDRVCVPIGDLLAPTLPAETTAAFDVAYANIKAFHAAQRSAPLEVETMPGVTCRRVSRPIGAQTHCSGYSIRPFSWYRMLGTAPRTSKQRCC